MIDGRRSLGATVGPFLAGRANRVSATGHSKEATGAGRDRSARAGPILRAHRSCRVS